MCIQLKKSQSKSFTKVYSYQFCGGGDGGGFLVSNKRCFDFEAIQLTKKERKCINIRHTNSNVID